LREVVFAMERSKDVLAADLAQQTRYMSAKKP